MSSLTAQLAQPHYRRQRLADDDRPNLLLVGF